MILIVADADLVGPNVELEAATPPTAVPTGNILVVKFWVTKLALLIL